MASLELSRVSSGARVSVHPKSTSGWIGIPLRRESDAHLRIMEIQRFASFATASGGGNPAGVVLCERLPDASTMQQVASEVGYSETVFAAPLDCAWRTRYFAPELEVPFCGHATIALGAALAARYGSGSFTLVLNETSITIHGCAENGALSAALESPRTCTEELPRHVLEAALSLFNLDRSRLDDRIPVRMIMAGARHLVLPLAERATLEQMSYDFSAGRSMMIENRWTTIMLVHTRSPHEFQVRNAFASGGVYEDPATGAAAAAFAGYLRELGWPHEGKIKLTQGEQMGYPSELFAEIPAGLGEPVRVTGRVRLI